MNRKKQIDNANLLLAEQRYEEAGKIFDELLIEQPDFKPALVGRLKCWIESAAKGLDDIAVEAKRCELIFPEIPFFNNISKRLKNQSRERVINHLKTANEHYNNKNFDAALNCYTQIKITQKNSEFIYNRIADCHYKLNNEEQSINYILKLIQSRNYIETKDYQKLIKNYNENKLIKNIDIIFENINTYFFAKPKNSILTLKTLIQYKNLTEEGKHENIFPEKLLNGIVDRRVNLIIQSLINEKSGNIGNALQILKELESDHSDFSVYVDYLLCQQYSSINDYINTIHYAKKLEFTQEFKYESLKLTVNAHLGLGENDKCNDLFKRFLLNNPNADQEIEFLRIRHNFFRQTRRWRSAKRFTESLIEKQPNSLQLKLTLSEYHSFFGEALAYPIENLENLDQKTRDEHQAQIYNLSNWYSHRDEKSQANETELIDVVYTWVDSTDPDWMKKFKTYNDIDLEKEQNHQTNWRRYTNYTEIIYSLLLLEKHFKNLGKIYIVTDNQRFDTTSLPNSLQEKICFVDHQEIISDSYVSLPTFNSDIIECFIHRIEKLTEKFLYLNDDTFLGAKCTPADFFKSDEKPYYNCYYHQAKDTDTLRNLWSHYIGGDNPLRNARTSELFFNKTGYRPSLYSTHQAIGLTKKLCNAAFAEFEQDLKDSLFSFRVRDKYALRWCLLRDWYAMHKGFSHAFVKPSDYMWLFGRELDWEHVDMILSMRPRFFCINVTPDRVDRFEFLMSELTSAP